MRETDTANDVLKGAIRREVKITLWRYDTPTSKPVKAGVRVARGWTLRHAVRNAKALIPDMLDVDRAKRRREHERQIARIERARDKRLTSG